MIFITTANYCNHLELTVNKMSILNIMNSFYTLNDYLTVNVLVYASILEISVLIHRVNSSKVLGNRY